MLLPLRTFARPADVFVPRNLVLVGLVNRGEHSQSHHHVRIAITIQVHGMSVTRLGRMIVDDMPSPSSVGLVFIPRRQVARASGAEQVGLAVTVEVCRANPTFWRTWLQKRFPKDHVRIRTVEQMQRVIQPIALQHR
jgi:hypothetical protein